LFGHGVGSHGSSLLNLKGQSLEKLSPKLSSVPIFMLGIADDLSNAKLIFISFRLRYLYIELRALAITF
jgi:hypothetical protein